MWEYKLGQYTVGERTEILMGKNVTPFMWGCRCCWAIFALWTMSVPGTEAYISPVQWLIFVGVYYYYPL